MGPSGREGIADGPLFFPSLSRAALLRDRNSFPNFLLEQPAQPLEFSNSSSVPKRHADVESKPRLSGKFRDSGMKNVMKRSAWILALATLAAAQLTGTSQQPSLPAEIGGDVDIGIGQVTPSASPMGVPPQSCDAGCCCRGRPCDRPLCLRRWHFLTPFRRLLSAFGCECCYLCCACDPPSPAEALAARIKAEEACACSRRAAVRYLGTVDCHYYPEAEEALITALRCDRNCCVRMEAATGLGNGCCCTPRVIETLNIVISGSEADGNPHETSPQVRVASYHSLQRLLAFYEMARRAGMVRPGQSSQYLAQGKGSGVRSQAVSKPGSDARLTESVAKARQVLAQHTDCQPPPPARNIRELVANLGKPRTHSEMAHTGAEPYFCDCEGPGQQAKVDRSELSPPAFDLPGVEKLRSTTNAAALSFEHEPEASLQTTSLRATSPPGDGGIALAISASRPVDAPKVEPPSAVPTARRYLPPGLIPIGQVPPADEMPN